MSLSALATLLILSGWAVNASGQSLCSLNSGANPLLRAEGYNDLAGDIVITCFGGTPTFPGTAVPQVNITVTLNGNITSKITASLNSGATVFNEALLLMDDPNSVKWNNSTAHPITNCGLHGEDSSAAGPGVCAIYSDGTPEDTYDGSQTVQGLVTCASSTDYGCGRPNVFQGRQTGAGNSIQFLGIPFDPPAANATRTLRITNLRIDAAGYGVASPFSMVPVIATVSLSNNAPLSLASSSVSLGQVEQGLVSQITQGSFLQCTDTATSTGDPANPFYSGGMNIRVLENFSRAFKVRNVRQILDNGTLAGVNYVYAGTTTLNAADYDQNVPGVVYGTETGFYFPSTGSAAGPANPPAGFGSPVTGGDVGSRFANGGTNTGISQAGQATQGTRIAVVLGTPPAGAQTFVPIVVALKNQATNAQTGVMVLTDTDANGAGPFSRSASANLPSPVTAANNALWAPLPASGTALYEVLFSDPNSLEYADIAPSLVYSANAASTGSISVSANFAPTYNSSSLPGQPSNTLPEPRFAASLAPAASLYSIMACTVTSAASTSVSYSPNNQNIQLSATVMSGNNPVGSGTVAFSVAGIGGPVTSGTVNGGLASVSFPIPGGTPATTYQITAAYSGSSALQSSSDSTKVLTITKATPVVTWANPADIVVGTALGSAQLNATADAPGTFVYNPPAGTVLPVGAGETLSTVFTPSDAANYSGASATALINVLPAAQHNNSQVTATGTLSRDPSTDEIVALVTVSNTGTTGAGKVQLTVARIDAGTDSTVTTTALPQPLGSIGKGSSAQVSVRFPATAGTAGTSATLTLGGTHGGGSFVASVPVTLP